MHRFLKCRRKQILFGALVFVVLYYFGVFTHMLEKNYYDSFEYPLNEDILPYVEQLKNKDVPSRAPINGYNYTFLKPCTDKCKTGQIRLVVLVKSAMDHFDRREVIRKSYGYERRFSDVTIKTIFILGVSYTQLKHSIQSDVDKESDKYNDIVQADFKDSYFNNTIKTMMGFKWAMTHCSDSNFYLFTDDDMYISVKNVLRFVRNPSHYPAYVEKMQSLKKQKAIKPRDTLNYTDCNSSLCKASSHCTNVSTTDHRCIILDSKVRNRRQADNYYDLPEDVVLYAGYMFHTAPHRHPTSKWYITLDEYPYHMWPPYISAGAYILSKEALTTMYYASFYTAHFRFDDIYLGILAKKCAITPFHTNEFYFYKKFYSKDDYKYVIASHGFENPLELLAVWNEQKESGNA